MDSEDTINLSTSTDSGSEIQTKENHDSERRVHEIHSKTCKPGSDEGIKYMEEDMGLSEDESGNKVGRYVVEREQSKDTIDGSSFFREHIEVAETVATIDKLKNSHGIPICNETIDAKCGVKRARITLEETKPSVRLIYNSLTRASKQKLEKLLQQWSEWQAEHDANPDPNQILESGEETYFAALRVGMENSSSVSFCLDNQTIDKKNKGSVPLDISTTPLYDRGFARGLSLKDDSSNMDRCLDVIDDPARCFNCGSYVHQLKDCLRPRDNAAINNAREQHKAKRNQNREPRVPTRYYQNSLGGKYDGLKPGILSAETRNLLGLGELDPPPWLNRMREIGYPPGYLDDEDQPSGITIYSDGDAEKEEKEHKKIIRITERKKKTVEFPGINAPIPKKADKRLWARRTTSTSSSHQSKTTQPWRSSTYFPEPMSGRHLQDQKWHEDLRRDYGSPFVEQPAFTSPPSSRYLQGHGLYDDHPHDPLGPREDDIIPRILGRTTERSAFYRDGYKEDFVNRDFCSYSRYSLNRSRLTSEERSRNFQHRYGYDSYGYPRW